MENLPTPRVAVFMAYYKRPEYTEKAVKAIEDAQEYTNVDFFFVEDDNPNIGLRNRIIDFFDFIKDKEYDIICKTDNDCCVPKNWLNDILKVFSETDVDILSPNVMPSNAAFSYGKKVPGLPYMPAEIVGGLWCMRTKLLDNIYFERHDTGGLVGAIPILRQIVTEKEPKIGWLPDVIVQDIGHWSGAHTEHIKSKDHEFYSKEVGRQINWSAV